MMSLNRVKIIIQKQLCSFFPRIFFPSYFSCYRTEQNRTEQNRISWKGPTKIIKSNCLSCITHLSFLTCQYISPREVKAVFCLISISKWNWQTNFQVLPKNCIEQFSWLVKICRFLRLEGLLTSTVSNILYSVGCIILQS